MPFRGLFLRTRSSFPPITLSRYVRFLLALIFDCGYGTIHPVRTRIIIADNACSSLIVYLLSPPTTLKIGILSFSDCLSSVFSAVRFLDLSQNVPIRAPLFFDGKFIRVSGNERVPASGLCPEKNNDVVRPPQHFFRSKLF